MSRALLALLIIQLAAPIEAGRPFGGFHGPASHHGFPVFHHRGSRARRFFFGGYICGYDCGWDDSGGYDYGYGYDDNYAGSSGNGYRNGFGGGAGNAVSVSNGLPGGYVPDPVGADIPPLIIPHNCWVRRALRSVRRLFWASVGQSMPPVGSRDCDRLESSGSAR
jgi:hypothetical protein